MNRFFAMLRALGCATVLIALLAGLTCDVPPAGSDIPGNAGIVKLQVNNLSGLPVSFEETYILVDDQVRHTQRFLPPTGPASSAEGISTLADTLIVRAQVANESDLNSLAVPGDLLAARVFRFGQDFQNGDTLVFDVPPPEEPQPNIIDCNGNDINDPLDIADGASDDCDSNTVPDECQADTDHDAFINPCDGCPNDVRKQAPGICGCGRPDTGDADEDGILNCVDTCTDTDDDGFGNPGFPANTCPQDGCVNDPLKSAPGICGCGVPDEGDADDDGALDCVDPCPDDFFDDSDNDGLCDGADPCPHDRDNDKDGDGVCGDVDACPDTPSGEDADSDGCSCSQRDPDNDGVDDCDDACAGTPTEAPVNAQGCACSQVNCNDGDPCTLDTCGAGICSNVFQDADRDGVCDANDECPDTPMSEEADADGCSCSQRDADSDGVNDCDDECAGTPAEAPVNAQGCACSQVNCNDGNSCTLDSCAAGICSNVFQDADRDDVCDANDECPGTPFGEDVDSDGCSCSQFDTDDDGVNNCDDECANTPAEQPVNPQGCACSQLNCTDGDPCTLDSCAAGVCSNVFQDADSDDVCDINDECPNTPTSEDADSDGCSCSQRDTDSDGVNDCNDVCAGTPAEQPVNPQGCACSQLNCDDDDACTLDSCNAGICSNVFRDADGDGVCDGNDQCPGFDDNLDTDGDDFPNGCDECPTQNSSAVDFDEDGCLDGTFNLDVRPNMCPNHLSAESNGLMPAALLGMSTFDVSQVDISTLRMTRADIVSGEIAPHGGQATIDDTGAPTATTLCVCNGTDADGRDDLEMRFRLDDFIEALQLAGLPDYTEVPVKLKGQLRDGTPFAAIDCVTTLPPSTLP